MAFTAETSEPSRRIVEEVKPAPKPFQTMDLLGDECDSVFSVPVAPEKAQSKGAPDFAFVDLLGDDVGAAPQAAAPAQIASTPAQKASTPDDLIMFQNFLG